MILVTGADGMMGGYVRKAFDGETLCATDINEYDITNYERGRELFGDTKPKRVLHLAAETDVDLCEKKPEHAFRINAIGTQKIARLCTEFKAEMTYISTTGVFDGTKLDLYTEFDEPNPLNVYAKTKWEGEKIVRLLCPHSYIVRAGWVFGGGPQKDKKFIGKMVALCVENEEVKVVNDKYGSPTYARDFVDNLRVLMDSGYHGTYHLTGIGACTRYDMACELVKILGLPTKLVPVSSAVFPLPAPRPRSDAVLNFHTELLGLNRMRPWQEALADYLKDWPIPKRRMGES